MEKSDSAAIASAYDSWSEKYDNQENATRDLDELVLRRIVPDVSGRTVVECGCGTGKNSVWLAPSCAQLVGFDFSAGMLRIARSKVKSPRAVFLLQDLRRPWPLRDAAADIVLFNLVLEHIEDLKPVFREAARVLRHGGQMVLSEYHPNRVSSGKGPVVLAEDGTVSHRIPNYLHTMDDCEESARRSGMVLVSASEWGSAEHESGRESDAASRELPQLISMVFSMP